MINIDKKNYEYCTIDRDEWIKSILGEPVQNDGVDRLLDGINTPHNGIDGWMMPNIARIKAEIETMTGREYTATECENTYNHENNFSGDFQYVVFSPTDDTSCGEWYYSADVYVAIERHLGGDPRGNYGNVELFGPVDSLADSSFLDWVLGWDVSGLNGKRLECESDQTSIGYAQNPTCELSELFITRNGWEVITRYSEKLGGFMARTLDGKTAVLTPYTNAEYC